MTKIREHKQKQSANRHAAATFLRADLALSTVRMFVCIIKMQGIKESAP